jgi:hypothetical protein
VIQWNYHSINTTGVNREVIMAFIVQTLSCSDIRLFEPLNKTSCPNIPSFPTVTLKKLSEALAHEIRSPIQKELWIFWVILWRNEHSKILAISI